MLEGTQQNMIQKSDVIMHSRTIFDTVKSHAPDTRFFEFITMMAFLEFQRQGCDYVVLECGVGGRFDATNIVQDPVCSVITSIGLDHMEMLGETKELICKEKAEIIKN